MPNTSKLKGTLKNTFLIHFGKDTDSVPTTPRARAESICELGDYAQIIDTFSWPENKGLLPKQIVELKKKYGRTRLKEASLHLTQEDWEMLTVLELFDHDTFEHCLRTYEMAREKIHHPGTLGVSLRELISAEGMLPWDIELACLLHDMGKIVLIPKNLILNNRLGDEQWRTIFESFCQETVGKKKALDHIGHFNGFLEAHPEKRPVDITPLAMSLTPDENEYLKGFGIDTNLSLKKIIDKHQEISGNIVARYHPNHPMLDLIANHHETLPRSHDHEEQATRAPKVALGKVLSILRLADLYDAYHYRRAYRCGHSVLSTLAFLIRESKRGFIDIELTRLWVENELEKFDAKAATQTLTALKAPLPSTEETAYQNIRHFLFPNYRAAA